MTQNGNYSIPDDILSTVDEDRAKYGLRTYVSLFSSAGVGCYGFKQEHFYCVATVELLERRLKIQRFNEKCIYPSGYICGDMTVQSTKDRVFAELDRWKRNFKVADLDVLIATPPCQGMSVANHKKKDELKRNSLVVESLVMTSAIKPKFFLFENVRAFLTSVCTDIDGCDKPIRQAIEDNLAGQYNILYQVLNFKDYGCPSSRTRTIVIGVRKDLKEVTPYDIFPDKKPERTLRQIIGHLPALTTMGEISKDDIYHNFRSYSPYMESWIADIKEGESAFDNTDPEKIPHVVREGRVIYNARKNGDKYTRQFWDKVAPCIHTRNDIMASQNTVHPRDNRVFSIREVMLMMSVPDSFQWSATPYTQLNAFPIDEKRAFLKKEEMNIRQNLGEAVPTVIFRQIASKVKEALLRKDCSESAIKALIEKENLTSADKLLKFVRSHHELGFITLSKIAELANAKRENNSAYYTRQDVCFAMINTLPEPKGFYSIKILEPAVGVGNFLPILVQKYKDVPAVHIDVVDVDENSLEVLKELVMILHVPDNVRINFINDDFLLHSFDEHYDIVVGNPPYKKITKEQKTLKKYKEKALNSATNNVFSFFIEKSLELGDIVSLVVPKSLINAPEFDETRKLMSTQRVQNIIDFGEKGFHGVKIETVAFTISTNKRPDQTRVESYITDTVTWMRQDYLADNEYPYWLIYRNEEFDRVAAKMQLGLFRAFRDRSITKRITKESGKIRVLKSRNIGDNKVIDIPGYDCYMDNIDDLAVSKFLNQRQCVLVPNLTYYPRACFLPPNSITDGSVAILTTIDDHQEVTEKDLAFYATEEFGRFYAIARNRGTRSLNVDNNSVFFYGKLK